jgi:hypothetical protein
MKKIIRLTESDLTRIIKRVIKEEEDFDSLVKKVFGKKTPNVSKVSNKNEMDESILRFSDGEEFDTSGPLRKEERYDGWYVIGNGKLIPAKDEEDADEKIERLMDEPRRGYRGE